MKRESIWRLSLKRTRQAIISKSIIPFKTKLKVQKRSNYKYELRTLIGKPKIHKNTVGPKLNPFMPWEKELEILKINNTHVLILNKYPVELGHMLLITNTWKPQNGWLDYHDWSSLSYVNKDTSGLWFFNNSSNAGASQPHRHLQLLRRKDDNNICPRQSWYDDYLLGRYSNNIILNNSCIVHRLNNRCSADELNHVYLNLCKKMDIGDPLNNIIPVKSYNLLITNKWMAIISRNTESYKGFDINALGFAGYFLVTPISDISWFNNNNAEDLLEAVVSPYK